MQSCMRMKAHVSFVDATPARRAFFPILHQAGAKSFLHKIHRNYSNISDYSLKNPEICGNSDPVQPHINIKKVTAALCIEMDSVSALKHSAYSDLFRVGKIPPTLM